MEISSWSFLIAGFAGGIGRSVLFLFSTLGGYGNTINLIETVGFVLGTFIFVRAQTKERPVQKFERSETAVSEML